MRLQKIVFVLTLSSGFVARSGLAQETGTTTIAKPSIEAVDSKEASEKISPELLDQIKAELKAEIKQELAAEGDLSGGVKDDQWSQEQWKWSEPAKPSLNFFELDGYFRFRYDFFHNLDLDTFYNKDPNGIVSGPYSGGNSPPVPICNTDPDCAAAFGESDSLGGANIRLRLEPVLNVYEDVRVKMQVDVLDNLVLGSTPDGFPANPLSPLIGFSQTQIPPSDGTNALADSIRVKQVWAEVFTPLGQLRFGRMPSHFGMGLLANEGRGLDKDFGDTNDRIMFATKIAGHYIVPGFDWSASGPSSVRFGVPQGQPFDRDQRDDVDQYILAIAKRDKKDVIEEKLKEDQAVLNYGVYGVYREQALTAGNYFKTGDVAGGVDTSDLIRRDLSFWAYSAWAKFLWRQLEVEFEHAGIVGDVGSSAIGGSFGARGDPLEISMFAAAASAKYKLFNDALSLELLTVFASGDNAPGWGIQPLETSPTPGTWDGGQNDDGKINNFRIDPDFQVDLILWRQLVGMVTDAVVFRPGLQYNITEGLGGRIDLVYSRAVYGESTPSAGISSNEVIAELGHGQDNNLGVELDAKIFYASDDGFHAWLEYGVLFPLAGLDAQVRNMNNEAIALPSSLAQTLQAMFAVQF
ncbi:MAG: TIGR04551 family protein [Myxococcota bacterium]|nr:TIGR04551 family protein [Myxococcota bacterium]